ncbi:beta-ketoacyl-ACP synthase [Lusitaniella coriacea LEGE 07157]|uniref:Beta-ketoacyl-ACP synthase n=1 Tax=Lusitaniella coriacea LEGE 07157 TaxID=945747 RepID=A0A8J7DYI6_9CYAN|nr:beta-ketoacyl-ACP synthase [Lusitaniella coriacea]MBE9117819.1 beta-ketoacyl-ACP synthase [Lusitaniella coriacea LEGE 07157]
MSLSRNKIEVDKPLGEVVVTGIGLVSSLGTLKESWQRLLAGESGIRRDRALLELPSHPLGLIGQTPISFLPLTEWAVEEALQDAGLTPPLQDCGVVIGSSRGAQGTWEAARLQVRQHGMGAFPQGIVGLPPSSAIAAARKIGATGAVLAPMAACATGIWSIARAVELLQTGQYQRAIAGAIEAPITPLTLAGFAKMGALAKTGCYPFDRQREGLVLGEGAAIFVLETPELARQRGAKAYGKILGFGLTADGHHVSAPDPNGKSAIAAVRQCLERSNLNPSAIDYIHAHGTSTILNDRNEAQLIQSLFPHGVAVSSTKGATGHTLGASGAIGAAFCLMALHQQVLPPCVGLQNPEFDLDFVRKARLTRVQHALCLSFGFGGQNTAIAIALF